jgi:hydrogenase-4 component B
MIQGFMPTVSSHAMLLVAGAGLALGILLGRWAPRAWLAVTLGACFAGLWAAVSVLAGGPDLEWRSAAKVGGEPLHLSLDGLGALFLALVGVLGGAGALYASESWNDRAHPRSAGAGRVWWSLLVGCLALVLLSRNGLHFLIGWELFTLAAYFLVTLDRQRPEVRAAGWLFLGASHVAVLFLFAFFAALAARTGSWELGPLREEAGLAPLFWLALLGFGLKAGLFPLHVWLPSAHANAPSHVSAILSGVSLKLGIYGLLRFTSWLPVPASAGWVVAALGMASALLGVAFALGQHDLKRLLAYHSVENIGIILIGLGFALVAAGQGDAQWGRLVLAGGLLHVWNHGLFKALLFLGAGSVLHACGTREMSLLGGLWRAMPWTTGLFALGAVAICGLPPLNGFVSEWLVYLGLFDAANTRSPSAWGALPAAILLGVTGALALACFVKVCGVVFLGAARSEAAARAHECGGPMRAAMLALALACAAIGLAPVLFWPSLARVIGDWRAEWGGAETSASLATLGFVHVVLALLAAAAGAGLWWRARRGAWRRASTWGCGFAAPTARMQYTAGSFAAIITEWFGWILQPARHATPPVETFPGAASFAEHTPETVLERIVEPVGRAILRVALAARALQHGRVQAYILYLVVGIAALAGVVLLGTGY